MRREELIAKALSGLRTDRQRAITLAEQRRALAYEKIPRLLALDNLSIETGLALARLGASRAGAEKLAEKQAQLDAIEAERAALLTQNGFDADALQPKFRCPICKDTGRDGSHLCRCVEQRVRALRREELMRTAPLAGSRFDNFDLSLYPDRPVPGGSTSIRRIMENNLVYCREYAANFGPGCPSLFLTGNAGLGKTHLALAIAGELITRGVDLLYIPSQIAFARIEQERREDPDETLGAMLDAELLILDDLGSEYLTGYLTSCIYRLVDTRLVAGRPTIYTSNIQAQQTLNARYGEKVGSRLFGECEILRFYGEDLRLIRRG